MASKTEHLDIGNRRIAVSNLDKILYPGKKFTKARVIDYYIRISKYLLPHLKNRPVTLKRFPDGVFGEFFYEKDAPAFTPSWVNTFPVPRTETAGKDIRYILINDVATLVWLANLANLEIHPFLHRAPRIDRPTSMVFDCDPGEGANILSCARVALMLREVLQDLALESYVKVSGSKGVQVYVPLNSAVSYDQTSTLAKAIAELLAAREPDLIVSQMAKRLRTKRVFIDWSQNTAFKTTVGVYSLRAKTHRPYVSVPVDWDEVSRALATKDADDLFFTPEEAIERTEQLGDLFKPVLKKVQKLPPQLRKYFEETHVAASDAPLKSVILKRKIKARPASKSAAQRSRQGSRRRFTIQKIGGKRLQYNLRLEMQDVLKTWSMPKGLPSKKGEKRPALATADESIEALDPKPRDGRGDVQWDAGTYELIEGNYSKGSLHFHLVGAKLKGEWTLERSRTKNQSDADQWEITKVG